MPGISSEQIPDKAAITMAAGAACVTYAQLDRRSTQLARFLAHAGLSMGDHIAVMAENRPEYLEVCWAAQRSGLYYTPVSTKLSPEEAAYIIDDCDARVLITTCEVGELASAVVSRTPGVERRLVMGDALGGHEAYEAALAGQPTAPLEQEIDGKAMLYTSGTSGRPKGIVRPIRGRPVGSDDPRNAVSDKLLGFEKDTVYLSIGPLHHSGPLITSMTTHRVGGSLVVMKRFDAQATLEAIERFRVTRVQLVPTMMWRLLNLPREVRERYDLSSLRYVMHSGAPCPADVKRGMIEWLGPIVNELYAASEGFGRTFVTSQEWLERPGCVGKAVACEVHITDDEGRELPTGEDGVIWFSGPGTRAVHYHNAPEQTAEAFNDRGWATVGDIGHADAAGYLYVTDRRANMIITGGVNVYPQQTENVLLTHPLVADAAVVGVSDPEWGQQVRAVVELVDPATASRELQDQLISYCRARVAHYKCPRAVDFRTKLPRQPDGKLPKRLLSDADR